MKITQTFIKLKESSISLTKKLKSFRSRNVVALKNAYLNMPKETKAEKKLSPRKVESLEKKGAKKLEKFVCATVK